MKGKLTILVGPSGSGKSTYADNKKDAVRISSDKLREELYGDEALQYSDEFLRSHKYAPDMMTEQEKRRTCNNILFKTMDKQVKKALKTGDVIYDATSLTAKTRKGIIDEFKNDASEIEAVCLVTDIDECKKRNRERDRSVPEEVIDLQFKNYEKPKLNEGFSSVVLIYNSH
jgi:Predicted kinase